MNKKIVIGLVVLSALVAEHIYIIWRCSELKPFATLAGGHYSSAWLNNFNHDDKKVSSYTSQFTKGFEHDPVTSELTAAGRTSYEHFIQAPVEAYQCLHDVRTEIHAERTDYFP